VAFLALLEKQSGRRARGERCFLLYFLRFKITAAQIKRKRRRKMEENKNSEQLDDELLVEEPEEEASEEDTDDDFDEEEYDFNDEDDDLIPEDEDEDSEDEDSDEEEAPEVEEKADEEKSEAKPEEKSEEKPQKNEVDEQTRAMMDDMLDRLGFKGTYEEKLAAYEAEKAEKAAEKATEKTSEETVDYHAMAEADLRDINAAFGTNYKDFSAFDDLNRFAALRVKGATALEAFRATQKNAGGAPSQESEESVTKPSKEHIAPLPVGTGGGGSRELSAADKQTIAQLKSLYPDLSRKDLMKSLNRIKKSR
jgi:hypothetical protein